MMEIQEKTIFVWDSTMFEFSRVNCISHTINSYMYKQWRMIITKLRTFLCEQILFLPCDIIQTGCFFFGGKK